MSIKTEEAKIVETIVAHILGTQNWEADTTFLEEALATYKVSILAECEKCVPEEIEIMPEYRSEKSRSRHEAHNHCRAQTLQAINSLK